MCDDDVLALACATECEVACALPEKYEHLTGEIYSSGSCYDMRAGGGRGTISCDVAQADCLVPGQMIYWYEPDYLSGYTGCSHCDAANKGDAGFGNSGAPCGYTPFDATVSGGAHFYEHDHHDLAALYAKGNPANCTAWAAAGHNCSTDAVGALLCGAHCYVAHPVDNDAASGNTTCAAAAADTGCDAFVAYACPATCQASLAALGYGELTGDDYVANNDALAAARFNSSCSDLVAQCGAADVVLACPEICEGWSEPSAAPTPAPTAEPTPAPSNASATPGRKPKVRGCGRATLAEEKKCNKNKRCKWVFGSHECMSDCALASKSKKKCNNKKHCKYNKSTKKCKNKKHACKYKAKKKHCRQDESCRVAKGKESKYDAKGNRVFKCRDRKD
jgi:hypothetical protein